jgi:hypothetical protein
MFCFFRKSRSRPTSVATTGIRVIKEGKPLGLKVVNGSGE